MSNTYSEMNENADKRRKIYVDYPKGNSKPTCPIHGSRHSLDKYKVLGDFGFNYAKIRHTNNRGHNPENKTKCTRQQYNNAIVNSAVDEIIMQKDNKVSSGTEAQEIIESEFGLVPAQDVHFFYTRSHLSALQNCAVLFSTNFYIIFILKKCITQFSH